MFFVLLLLPKKARTVRFRLDTKIHVEKGYQLDASLDLHFEFLDRLEGADNTGGSLDIVETIDGNAPEPGRAFLFEMRPCHTEEEDQEQDNLSILTLPVTHRVDTVLAFIPPSVLDDFQKVHILATAVSQDEKTVVTVSRKGRGVEFFLDIWDLNGYHCYANSKEMKDLIKSKRRVAWSAFTINGVETLNMSFLDVSLSSNGELVAVFDKPDDTFCSKPVENGFPTGNFPLRVFQRKPATTTAAGVAAVENVTTAKKVSDKEPFALPGCGGGRKQVVPMSEGLEEVSYDMVSPLFTFAGYAKFQHRSEQSSSDKRKSTDPQDFVLVTCNGWCLEVYEARTGLKLLHTISLTPLSLSRAGYQSYELLMKTLQNSMFVWFTDSQSEISVWNWRTGKNVGFYPKGFYPVLSMDESLLVVFGASIVRAYSTENRQLQGLRTNVAWSYRWNEHVNIRHDFLSQGSGRLAMLERDSISYIGEISSELVRYLNMRKLEDIQATTFAIPLRSWPIHVLPSTTLVQESAIGAVIVGSSKMVKVLNLEPDKTTKAATATVTVCGPNCSVPWKDGHKNCFFDEEQRRTFRIIRNSKKKVTCVVRIRDKSKSNTRGMVVLELPFPEMEEEHDPQRMWWTILQGRNQFYVQTDSEFELWQFPTSTSNQCTLLGVGDKHRTSEDYWEFMCAHGSLRRGDGDEIVSRFGTSEKELAEQENIISIWHLIKRYTENLDTYPVTYQKAIVDFIARHINKDPGPTDTNKAETNKTRTSFMWKVVRECVRSGNDALLLGVLNSSSHLGYWIPSPDEFSDNAEKDMIAHLIVKFKLPVAKILIDYCLERAHSTDSVLLEKLMISVPHLISKHPDVALNIARRAAFLPVLNRDQILQQAVYNGDQWRRGKFWVPVKSKLYEVIDQNPVFHRLNRLAIFDSNKTQDLNNQPGLLPVTAETVKKNANIKTNLYMAPFSLVWTIQENEDDSKKAKKDGKLLTGQVIDKEQQLSTKTTKSAMPAKLTAVAGSAALVLRMIGHFIFPFDKVFIHSHYDDLQAYDNPAFSALATYKWTRFARYFWCLRLSFQISYEFSVLVVTLFQLYGDEEQRADLVGGYIAIIVLGYMLLHIEFQQMRGGIGRYFS